MKRPLAYITAAWCGSDCENAKQAAQYCRSVYDAGFSPICPPLYHPLFLNDAIPEEHPYVWGGYSPSTSFDCSGFVSYVYNQCGWDFGRLGAQGLYNISTRTSSPRPGDLVFFTGTYDTPGVSHQT